MTKEEEEAIVRPTRSVLNSPTEAIEYVSVKLISSSLTQTAGLVSLSVCERRTLNADFLMLSFGNIFSHENSPLLIKSWV